jgi:hypothetical protein
MLAYQHSGFSVDAGVCIEAHDRAELERLLRYCARSPFAMDRLRKEGAALVPPPRAHRHRYFGVLAPNSPLMAAVTAMAAPEQPTAAHAVPAAMAEAVSGVASPGYTVAPAPEPGPPKRAAHYLWAQVMT